MTEYNFDKTVNRSGTHSLKWDVAAGELPMWVADMDFEVCPDIAAAVQKRAAHPVYGYNILPDEWYQAYADWWQTRHGWQIQKDWLMFSTGVVPSISSIVRRLTLPAEKVLLQTPVYNIFFNSVVNNGRYVVENRLVYRNGQYSVDFADLEQKLSDPQVSLMILCNPQNPVGKIWDKPTLEKIGQLCRKYNVVVLSDEIHCDITQPGKGYVPFASVSDVCRDNCVVCLSPTKAFNIAGLQTSAIAVPNPVLCHKIWRGINNDEIAEPNTFAVWAAVAAFQKGGRWLDELRCYVWQNRRFCSEFLQIHLPQLHAVEADATYLLWVDCSQICNDSIAFCKFLRKQTGLFVSAGTPYGETGKCFVRINLACPLSALQDGVQRLKRGVDLWVDSQK